jgi:hypothetical protein
VTEDRIYTCAECGERCMSSWSEEEAEAEWRRDFPNVDPAQRVEVCEDCYRTLAARHGIGVQ